MLHGHLLSSGCRPQRPGEAGVERLEFAKPFSNLVGAGGTRAKGDTIWQQHGVRCNLFGSGQVFGKQGG